MKKLVLSLILILISVSRLSAEEGKQTVYQLEQFVEKDVGFFITENKYKRAVVVEDENAITGSIHEGGIRKDVKLTDKIRLIKGNGFDVNFNLTGKYLNLKNVDLVVLHPVMDTPQKGKRVSIKRKEKIHEYRGFNIIQFGYQFDEPWEMVEGIWHIKIYHEKKLLGHLQVQVKLPKEKVDE